MSRRTFIATFASGNTAEDMTAYVERSFSAEKMRKELTTPGSTFYFLEAEDGPVGYLKVNVGDAQTEQLPGDTLEIERIYVEADRQGEGFGKALLDFALAEARRAGREAVWLGVWENNPKAIAFYERKGFVPFGAHDFTVGADVQTDILMRLELP